jgi:GNAT superfamily N-acetyltransferase
LPAPIRIRDAERDDISAIFAMVVELAEYERAREQVVGTPQMLADALFGPERSASALIAELDEERAGFALFYRTFSTWECRPGIWLEDLYVPPRHRRSGVGRALLSRVARVAVEQGCTRLEWAALDWNTPALDFYRALGASLLDDWRIHRLDRESLRRVAQA